MARVGIRELRQNASALIRRVIGGENIEVTDRGRPVARIVPLRDGSVLDQMIVEGRASRPRRSPRLEAPRSAPWQAFAVRGAGSNAGR